MAMAQLSARKRWLTRCGNALQVLVDTHTALNKDFPAQQATDQLFAQSKLALMKALTLLESGKQAVDTALTDFTTCIDALKGNPTDADMQTITEYSEKASDKIEAATRLMAELKFRQMELEDHHKALHTGAPNLATAATRTAAPQVKLPEIPLPTFTGKVWEWDNFWTLFKAKVDDQQISDLEKFNYLQSSLSGEARRCLLRYRVTADNYAPALATLKKKYGNDEAIIAYLSKQFEKISARSTRLLDQRYLLEYVVALINQLVAKDEDVNSKWILRKTLSKFNPSLQRKVLQHKAGLQPTDPWDMEVLLTVLGDIITNEEQINEQIDFSSDHTPADSTNPPETEKKELPPPSDRRMCVFCKQDHKPVNCTAKKSSQERSEFLRAENRCFNCLGRGHSVKDCRSKFTCTQCGRRHHISLHTETTKPTDNHDYSKKVYSRGSTKPPKKGFSTTAAMETTHSHALLEEPLTLHSSADEDNDNTIQQLLINKESHSHDKVILLAGTARYMDPVSKELRKLHILLDTGSELSFINSEFATYMGLPLTDNRTLRIRTFGSTISTEKECSVTELHIWDADGNIHDLQLLCNDVLTGNISRAELTLSDQQFITNSDINLSICEDDSHIQPHILLGCDQLWKFLSSTQPQHTLPSGLLLIPSKLGYLVTGRKSASSSEDAKSKINSVISQEEKEQWDKFWSMDSAGIGEFTGTEKEEKTSVNDRVLTSFNESIQKEDDGYHVRLPWKEGHAPLPDNKIIALRRLRSVLHSFKNNPELMERYDQTFQEQLQKGIIEKVNEAETSEGPIHYIPHQAVLTPHKETTKLRIVFDASAHYKNCPSLNEVLHQGPLILPEMHAMLLRFRMHKYAIISDVEKAFLQVRLQRCDRDATRCLWIKDIHQPLSEDNVIIYRFTRVTFGLNASPFLLAATIKYHLENHEHDNQLVREIGNNLYVDNLLLGAATTEEAIQKYHDTKQIFNNLNMNLREYLSNDPSLNNILHTADKAGNASPKVLGIQWMSTTDELHLTCSLPSSPRTTKRSVSQQIASIYDPQGWLVPLLVTAKRFLQKLWESDYGWDDALQETHQAEWTSIVNRIHGFDKYIPRWVHNSPDSHCLITFSDASGIAMAACTYLWNGHEAHLLMGKSKLPSLKGTPTMPKLEMNAITIATRLTETVYQALKHTVSIKAVYIFSDSEIALKWLQNPPEKKTMGVLVSNRINEIRRICLAMEESGVQSKFGYVNTKQNPADWGTRGLTKDDLQDHYWWTGPSFLQSSEATWPKESNLFHLSTNTGEDPDDTVRPTTEESSRLTVTKSPAIASTYLTVQHTPSDPNSLIDLQRFSTLLKAERSLAYALRFIRKMAAKSNIVTSFDDTTSSSNIELTAQELKVAHHWIIRTHQTHYFDEQTVKSMKDLRIQKDHGLLRCYGRLGNADMDDSWKHPLLIGAKSTLSRLLIESAHGPYHLGIAHTMASVRNQYWIPQLRQQVRTALGRCVPCQRMNNLPYKYPDSPDLPSKRVQRSRPFEHVGLDYFGPLTVHNDHNIMTDESKEKIYVCILTCMTTRLIHLEVIRDMTTDSFLHTLRRFFARRGIPRSITSDNAPTFLLGEKILLDVAQTAQVNTTIPSVMTDRAIEWKHITPYSPWQGGFYERLIKSIKHSFYKSVGHITITVEQMTTVMTEIEAALNTRPLTYQEERWDNQPILRPIDFIQRDMIIGFPFEHIGSDWDDANYLPPDEACQLRTRRQATEALISSHKHVEKFWSIWQSQYLTSLRDTHKLTIDKKRRSTSTPTINDVVLVYDPNQPRHSWKIGRVVELLRGTDTNIREAELKTPSGRIIRRPVNHLIPLELDQSEEALMQDKDNKRDNHRSTDDVQPTHRYDLRERKPRTYADGDDIDEEHVNHINSTTTLRTHNIFPFFHMALIMSLLTLVTTSTSNYTSMVSCIPRGVHLSSYENQSYELCANDYCITSTDHPVQETIHFPPDITIHDHTVQWKIFIGNDVRIIQLDCPAHPFCASIDCTFCTVMICNPECWPKTSIAVMGFAIYLMVAIVYALLYTPFVLGKPVRILTSLMSKMVLGILHIFRFCIRGSIILLRRRRGRGIADALALLMIFGNFNGSAACQEVNILTHTSNVCRTYGPQKVVCKFRVAEVLKINPYQQEACLRLQHDNNTFTEIKIQWKKIILQCEKETLLFTRDTRYHIIDSKRCPHMGSCTNGKCSDINRTSLLPELQEGNELPGNTHCLESCGGPGCDCFYLSSGCLFYRIYLKPRSTKIYEIFKCNRWKEEAQLEMTVRRPTEHNSSVHNHLITLHPNVPVHTDRMTVTLSSITIPPIPLLNTQFISDGTNHAIWRNVFTPPLQCSTRLEAQDLRCDVKDQCDCQAAEVRVHCECAEHDLNSTFNIVQDRFPVIRPALTFRSGNTSQVHATITNMATAEVILDIEDKIDTTITEVTDNMCKIEDSHVQGCYNCANGARTLVRCTTSSGDTMAEVTCGDNAFLVACNVSGVSTSLRIHYDKAQIRQQCNVSCGQHVTHFEVTGILKFTHILSHTVLQVIRGETQSYSDVRFPDITHIWDIYRNWYKTLLCTIVGVGIALVITYLFGIEIATFGISLLISILKHVMIATTRALQLLLSTFFRCMAKGYRTTHAKSL